MHVLAVVEWWPASIKSHGGKGIIAISAPG